MNEGDVNVIRVGYYSAQHDQRRPIKFHGKILVTASNQNTNAQHPNHTQYHVWTLYKVENGYRVLDDFITPSDRYSNHTGLSPVLTPAKIAELYPELGNKAIDAELWTLMDVVCEASDGEENGKPTPVCPADYKYNEKDFEEK